MSKKIKAFEINEIVELLSSINEKTDDVTKRLDLLYNLGPELDAYPLDDLGEILINVDESLDDLHYALATYMEVTGIDFDEEEETESDIEIKPEKIEEILEEAFEWADEEEEIAPETLEEKKEPEFLR